jgi:putative SOS response-associated peptidase YedK
MGSGVLCDNPANSQMIYAESEAMPPARVRAKVRTPRLGRRTAATAGVHHHIGRMCGRYASFLPAEALVRLFGTTGPLPNLEPTWNMAPTKAAPIVHLDPKAGERRLEVAKWGLVPFFTKDPAKARKPINARSETVARSPLFKEAFARRRCLVPASAYYEWRHDPSGKTPFAIARNDGEPVALGGMWEAWRSDGETLRTFATLTTEANPALALIQDRMPVIIERADWPLWLGETDGDVAALLRPLPADRLRIWPVERTVNNVRNDGPELLAPCSLPVGQPVLV